MANGDAATAAGYPVVAATADVREGYDQHNETRDMVALKTAAKTKSLGVLGSGTSNVQADLEYLNGQDSLAQSAASAAQASAAAAVAASTNRVSRGGDTMTGDLYLPNATPATFGWTILYGNGDGRVAKGASSERYKKFISEVDPLTLGDVIPLLYRYQMRKGDGTWRYGWIAERLNENPALAPFVVYDADGNPDSIDFISLLIVITAQLDARLKGIEEA